MKESVQAKNILLEMRPSLEGYAGIPQETRLLFRGLRMIEGLNVEGMIQTSHRTLARGTSTRLPRFFKIVDTPARKINRFSRVVVSMAEKPYRTYFDKIGDWFVKKVEDAQLTVLTLFGIKDIRLTVFESASFKDFIWRTMFSKTLPASDFELVSSANQKICSVPWHSMHMAGLSTLSFHRRPRYPTLLTEGVNIFIAQTPYPATLRGGTALVVRYHDALPVFMPHTIPNKSVHQATHFYALMNNARNGAYFACVSEATRSDLLKLFPEVGPRAVTIHNMVSHHYHASAEPRTRVAGIIRARLHVDAGLDDGLKPKFLTLREQENFYRRVLEVEGFRYLLIVSTLEPRKNHMRLLAAWEVIKAEVDPKLKLVVVGSLGWDFAAVLAGFRSWIDRGDLFCLNAVPAADLRVLYQHAEVTVCPSLGEGFDFSGVEAMASGGVVAASDIAVHREVYGDGSLYFDPYSTRSLVTAIQKLLYGDEAAVSRETIRAAGKVMAARYHPSVILPQWQVFLDRVNSER